MTGKGKGKGKGHGRAEGPAPVRRSRRSEPTRGKKVRVVFDERLFPSPGSWGRYAGRTGVVVRRAHGELMVELDNGVTAWFLPSEVEVLDE